MINKKIVFSLLFLMPSMFGMKKSISFTTSFGDSHSESSSKEAKVTSNKVTTQPFGVYVPFNAKKVVNPSIPKETTPLLYGFYFPQDVVRQHFPVSVPTEVVKSQNKVVPQEIVKQQKVVVQKELSKKDDLCEPVKNNNLDLLSSKLNMSNLPNFYRETAGNTTITHYFNSGSSIPLVSTFENGDMRGFILNRATINNGVNGINVSFEDFIDTTEGRVHQDIGGNTYQVVFHGKLAVLTSINKNSIENQSDNNCNQSQKNTLGNKNSEPIKTDFEKSNTNPVLPKNTEILPQTNGLVKPLSYEYSPKKIEDAIRSDLNNFSDHKNNFDRQQEEKIGNTNFSTTQLKIGNKNCSVSMNIFDAALLCKEALKIFGQFCKKIKTEIHDHIEHKREDKEYRWNIFSNKQLERANSNEIKSFCRKFDLATIEEKENLVKDLERKNITFSRDFVQLKDEHARVLAIVLLDNTGKNRKLFEKIEEEFAEASAKKNVNENLTRECTERIQEEKIKQLNEINLEQKKRESLENSKKQEDSKKINNVDQNIQVKIDKDTTVQVPLAEIAKQAQKDSEIIAQESKELLEQQEKVIESELEDGYQEQMFFYDKHKQYTEERINAALKDNANGNVIRTQEYSLKQELEKIIKEYGKDTEEFKVLIGNELQHATHKQMLETGNLILESKELTSDLKNLGMDFILTSAQFNKNGNPIKAGSLIDFCGALVDVSGHITKGVVTGAINAINPVRMAEGYIFLARQAFRVTGLASNFVIQNLHLETLSNFPIIGDMTEEVRKISLEAYNRELESVKKDLSEFVTSAKQFLKTASAGEVLECGTSMLVEAALTGKVQKAYLGFLEKQGEKIAKFAKSIKSVQEAEKIICTTPEGIEIGFSIETAESLIQENRLLRDARQVEGAGAGQVTRSSRRYEVKERFYKFLDEAVVEKALKKYFSGRKIKNQDCLDALRKKGLIGDEIKLTKETWSHILGQECEVREYNSGTAIRMSKDGCHDLKNAKNVGLKNVHIHEDGCIYGEISRYEANYNRVLNQHTFEVRHQTKSFFNCTGEVLVDKIVDIIDNIKNPTFVANTGRNFENIAIGIEVGGVKILSIIKKSGELITFYPVKEFRIRV